MTQKRYTIIVERAVGNYSAYAPDLPGVVAAADTVDETERLMREAIALYFEELTVRGESLASHRDGRRLAGKAGRLRI